MCQRPRERRACSSGSDSGVRVSRTLQWPPNLCGPQCLHLYCGESCPFSQGHSVRPTAKAQTRQCGRRSRGGGASPAEAGPVEVSERPRDPEPVPFVVVNRAGCGRAEPHPHPRRQRAPSLEPRSWSQGLGPCALKGGHLEVARPPPASSPPATWAGPRVLSFHHTQRHRHRRVRRGLSTPLISVSPRHCSCRGHVSWTRDDFPPRHARTPRSPIAHTPAAADFRRTPGNAPHCFCPPKATSCSTRRTTASSGGASPSARASAPTAWRT